MFPITDGRGRVIAFGGRALEKDVPAKYLNSPETTLFHKGDNLYNLFTARQAAHDGAQLIVVEGYVDVIAMVTSGFPGAVAPLGTALTENQLALLWKMVDEPILCFDGDRAGQKAAYRAADMALPQLKPGKSLRIALLPEGQDPDDLAPLRRPRCDRGGDLGGASACRHDLVARDRRRQFRHAGAPRRAGGQDRRAHQRHPRRGGAALLSRRTCRSGCNATSLPRAGVAAMAAAAATAGAISAAGRGGRITPPVCPPRTGPRWPGPAGSCQGRAPPRCHGALSGGEPAAPPTARSCAASAARSPAARP